MYIGKRIQELRKQKHMTLVALSDKSGVQVATLSRLENEKMTGTLESHLAIAQALEVDVTQLYSSISPSHQQVDVQKASRAKDIFVHSAKASYEILTTNVMKKHMMPMLLKIESGGQTNEEQNQIGTEKFIYILEGAVDITIGQNQYALKKHHSLYFDASLPHTLRNKGKTTVKLVCVVTPCAL